MILMFEGAVVFQKLKSLGALKGMGNKIRGVVYVYRSDSWVETTTDNLLPGDIMNLKKTKGEGGEVIPADVLLLNGATVVSEASLTGESIPQMKERISEMSDEPLAIKGKHKSHVRYAGTTMLQAKSGEDSDYPLIPNSPDSGCVCFVLRTGFTSAQGKLVRVIEGSQEKVKGSEVRTKRRSRNERESPSAELQLTLLPSSSFLVSFHPSPAGRNRSPPSPPEGMGEQG